jgi:hypothetical protein
MDELSRDDQAMVRKGALELKSAHKGGIIAMGDS